MINYEFFFSSRRRHTRCALVTVVQTCALPISEAGWDKVMDLNVKSPFFLTQALHPALKAAASADRPAKVINISSIDGIRLNPWETYSYQASKAALIKLTKRMAARLAGDAIHVTSIAPGAFASARR